MEQRVRARGRIKDIEARQTYDKDGNQRNEVKITFAENATPKTPNRPNYTINRPSYTINRPRQPNGIRYNVGEQHAEARTNDKQAEA